MVNRIQQRVKSARLQLGITQAELSQLSGLSLPIVQKLEYGLANPSLKTLRQIGDVLGFEITWTAAPIDWSMLVSAGLPLRGIPTSNAAVEPTRLIAEARRAWFSDTSARERECLTAFFLTVRRHYPSVWRRRCHGIELPPDMDMSRMLKLSRLVLRRLSKLL